MSTESLGSKINKELFAGRSLYDWLFLAIGIALQVFTYIITKDTVISFISGLSGVISVVYCSQRKVSFYFFGFVQLFTYVILCIQQNLYGEIAENIFYFATMAIGIFIWLKHYDRKENKVDVSPLTQKEWLWSVMICVFGSFVLGRILKLYTNDTQPYLDAFSTIPAFIAQILMIARKKEQWIFWIIVDITTGILWLKAGNYCMVAQYLFWIANCGYGYDKWNEHGNNNRRTEEKV